MVFLASCAELSTRPTAASDAHLHGLRLFSRFPSPLNSHTLGTTTNHMGVAVDSSRSSTLPRLFAWNELVTPGERDKKGEATRRPPPQNQEPKELLDAGPWLCLELRLRLLPQRLLSPRS